MERKVILQKQKLVKSGIYLKQGLACNHSLGTSHTTEDLQGPTGCANVCLPESWKTT